MLLVLFKMQSNSSIVDCFVAALLAIYNLLIINSASATKDGIVRIQKRLVIVTMRLAKDLS